MGDADKRWEEAESVAVFDEEAEDKGAGSWAEKSHALACGEGKFRSALPVAPSAGMSWLVRKQKVRVRTSVACAAVAVWSPASLHRESPRARAGEGLSQSSRLARNT